MTDASSPSKRTRRLVSLSARRRLFGLGALALFAVWAVVVFLLPTFDDAGQPLRLARLRARATLGTLSKTDFQSAAAPTRIPRIIHQSWKSATDIPSRFAPWMRSWSEMHPGWKYVFWNDDDNLALFDKLYPQYVHVAHNVGKIGLADMTRYALLHHFGGLYADADFECLRPFDQLHRDHDVFLSSEPRVHAVLLEHHATPALCNALMASVPGHPFWIQVLDSIKDMYDKGMHLGDPVALTGPRVVKETYFRIFQLLRK